MPTPPPPTLKTLRLFRVKLVDRANVLHKKKFIAARSLREAVAITGESIVLRIKQIGTVDLES